MSTALPSARIEIVSIVVELAFRCVVHDCGWELCAHPPGCCCFTVSDRVPADGPAADVLVVRDEPVACQEAVRAATAGRVRSIVLWDSPGDLKAARDGLEAGLAVVPHRVLELASMAPQLTSRQRETLRLLAKGLSNLGIASALHQSESTAKRDIADLLDLFDVPNRAALVSSAASLGFVPRRELSPSGDLIRQ